MSKREYVEITCDICSQLITENQPRIATSDTGLDFHLDCLKIVPGVVLLPLLDDSAGYYNPQINGESRRYQGIKVSEYQTQLKRGKDV